MARYRRVVADEFIDGHQVHSLSRRCVAPTATNGERQAQVSIIPGTALIVGPDLPVGSFGGPCRTFALAGANQSGPIYIADVNTLAGHDMDDWWEFDSITAIFFNQDRALNVVVPTGVSVTKGMGLTTNATGRFVPAGDGQRAIMTADETYNNNTGVYQHVRAFPASGA